MELLARISHKLSVRLHISWYIVAVSAGILLGIAGLAFAPEPIAARLEWPAAAAALLLTSFVKRQAGFVVLAVLGGVLVGLWQGATEQGELLRYEQYFGQEIRLKGRVVDDTVKGAAGDQRLRLGDVAVGNDEVGGEVWVSTSSAAEIKRGDFVTVVGVINPGFGNLSASMFRARLIEVERPYPGDVARRARDRFAASVSRVVPEPEATLGVSFITGMRRALPGEVSEQLRMLGLVHVVVASGYHLTIVVRAARKHVAKLSKYMATTLSGLVVAGFLFLTGFSTSMTRAALVTGISLAAWYYGRNVHPVVLLLFVAAVTALLDPSSLWGDIGWFLSFTAFGGVIILAPLIDHYFWGQDKEPGTIRHIVVATTAAQITTFPIIAFTFGHYSPLALVANLLVLPLVPYAMLLTFISGLLNMALPAIALVVAAPTYWVLSYITMVTSGLSRHPWASGEISIGIWGLVGCYALTVLLIVYLKRVTGHDFRRDNPVD